MRHPVLTILALCCGLLSVFPVAAQEYQQLTLRWKPPTTFSSGARLSQSILKEYRVYYGPSREEVRHKHFVVDAKHHSTTLARLNRQFVEQTPLIYLAVTAVSREDIESELSEIIFFLP